MRRETVKQSEEKKKKKKVKHFSGDQRNPDHITMFFHPALRKTNSLTQMLEERTGFVS